MEKVRCEDCHFEYGAPGWIDAVISDDIWRQITPDSANILCVHCINRRCSARGLDNIPVALNSGVLVPGIVTSVLPLVVTEIMSKGREVRGMEKNAQRYYIQVWAYGTAILNGKGELENALEISKTEYQYLEQAKGDRYSNRVRYLYRKIKGLPCGRDDVAITTWQDIDLVDER